MVESLERKRLSSSGLLDLWEHACLLYHNYSWQSAADTFSLMARLSPDPVDQRTFALNKGLIEARLGDFDLASMSFEKAISLDMDDPIAHFLLGVVSVELDDHSTGYAHFEHTLQRLPVDVLDYRTRGLDFGLARSAVQADAERLQAILKAGKHRVGKAELTPLCLHNIPAELIFEAPPRSESTLQEERISSGGHALSNTPRSDIQSNHNLDTSAFLEEPNSAGGTPSSTFSANDVETIEIDFVSRLSGTTSLLRPLPPKRLSPRDAQVRDGSTKELARFLRHAGPSGAANITVDRLYLQRLMQGYNSLSVAPQLYSQNRDSSNEVGSATSSTLPRNDLESLLDLYIGYRPERDLSPDGEVHIQSHVPRKPLPDAAASSPLATGKRCLTPKEGFVN